MKILSLELIGFKRMYLNNIQHFKIKITNQIQLILGTNGSGKSSLLNELTPLPANPSDYFKHGKKVIHIQNNNHDYIITSDFSKKAIHSFIKDDVELNQGGTGSAQKQLVKDEFKITPDIHQLLIGAKRFTQMDISERRNWLTKLSDVDYTFAIQFYNQLKTRHRDTLGALKKAKSRLAELAAEKLSEEEEFRIKSEVDELYKKLDELMQHRAPLKEPIHHYVSQIEYKKKTLEELYKKIINVKFTLGTTLNPVCPLIRDDWGRMQPNYFHSIEEVNEAIDWYKHSVTVAETELSNEVKQYNELDKTKRLLMNTDTTAIVDLEKQMNEIKTALVLSQAKRKTDIEFEYSYELKSIMESIKDHLIEIFTTVPLNDQGQYTQQGLNQLRETIEQLHLSIKQTKDELSKLGGYKNHYDAHKNDEDVNCPKCGHVWNLVYDQAKYDRLITRIDELNLKLDQESKLVALKELDLEDFKAYTEQYRSFNRYVTQYHQLKGVWKHLIDNKYFTNQPRSFPRILSDIEYDIQLVCNEHQYQIDIDKLTQLIQTKKELGEANLVDINEKLETKSTLIEEITARLRSASTQSDILHKERKQMLEAQQIVIHIEEELKHIDLLKEESMEAIQLEIIDYSIKQTQLKLAQLQESLQKINSNNAIYQEVEKQITSLVLEEQSAKLLVKELSPTEGLIAEGMMTFINTFIKKMNKVIKSIWSYQLEISPCQLSQDGSADLDYLFPVVVGHVDNKTPDVAKTSNGIKEVIDLAFKVTAMKYLGLTEVPLILDEFGASFDPAHRASASLAIKELIEHHVFGQLFMVSHYEANYGALTNAEICVICNKNIAVNESTQHNQHVEII